MARLVCHTSLLKDNDPRYKGGSGSTKMCTKCNLSIPETINHLRIQCPDKETAKMCMFNKIQKVDNTFAERCVKDVKITKEPKCACLTKFRRYIIPLQKDVLTLLYWLLGKQRENIETDIMTVIWIMAGHHIWQMYNLHIRTREGIC